MGMYALPNNNLMRSIQQILGLFFCIVATANLWAQSPTFTWVKTMGGNGDDYPTSIAVDDSGNVYTTGYFEGSFDFDPGPGTFYLTAASGQDIYISKLNSAGNFVWAKTAGGTYDEHGNSIVLDNLGHIYVTGYFLGDVDFNPNAGVFNLTSNSLSYDIFVMKLDVAGNFIWAKQIGGQHNDYANSLTLDPTGNILMTGYFSGMVDFDPGAGTFNLITLSTNTDIFVSKLDAGGNFIWAKAYSGTGNEAGNYIATDAAGNVLTTGYFGGTVDFNPGAGTFNLTASDLYNIFIAKLDASGNFVWAKSMGASSDDRGTGLCLDDSGNVFTTGFFGGTVDFDPGAGVSNLTSSGGSEIFVQKLSSTGNLVWAKKMGGSGWDRSYAISLDVLGNVVTTGGHAGTSDFDPGPGVYSLFATISPFAYVSKLDAMGNFVWAVGMAGNGDNYGVAITTDDNGYLYTAGHFFNTIVFGSNQYNSNGGKDPYIYKLFDCPIPVRPDTILGNLSLCSDSLVTYSITPVEGAQYYTWTFPAGWSGTSNTNSITAVVGPVGGTISVTANNACGNSPARTIPVTVNSAPAMPPAIMGDSVICSGTSNSYFVNPIANTNSYIWNLPGGWTGTSTTNSISTTAGTSGGIISVQPNNSCGSPTAQVLNIHVDTVIPVIADSILGNSSICDGSTNLYSITPAMGATSYLWTIPASWSGNSDSSSINLVGNSNGGIISVTAHNACGSSATQSLVVDLFSQPIVNLVLVGNDSICFGESITLFGIGANTFTWSGGIVDSVEFMPNTSSLYHVTGTDGTGCIDSDSIYIVVLEASVDYTVFPNDSLCVGDSITLTGTGTTTIIWSDSISNGVPFYPNTSNNYELIGIDNFGCSDTILAPIVVFSNPAVDLGPDIVQSIVPAILNAGAGFTSYLWNTNQTTQAIAVVNSGQYFVTVTSILGCLGTDTIEVIITAGVEPMDENQVNITLFPNPTPKGKFDLSIENMKDDNLLIEIIDISGKLIFERLFEHASGGIIIPFSLTHYERGTYFMRLTSTSFTSSHKFVIVE